MNNKEIVKAYVSGDIHLTPISNKFGGGILSRYKQIKYLYKMCDIVGWLHHHNISVNISLYKHWEYLSKLMGRKQDHTATIGSGYRSAIWGGEFEGFKYVVIKNMRGTSFEVDLDMDQKTAFRFVDFIEEILLNKTEIK